VGTGHELIISKESFGSVPSTSYDLIYVADLRSGADLHMIARLIAFIRFGKFIRGFGTQADSDARLRLL
jgi:hypothetical protein